MGYVPRPEDDEELDPTVPDPTPEGSRHPAVPVGTGDFMSGGQRDSLKAMLYPYLVDKMRRRNIATGGQTYANAEGSFTRDEPRADVNNLMGLYADSESMMGTLQGKRSEAGAVAKYAKDLNDSTQQKYQNEFALRGQEEKSLGTDLGIARLVGDLDAKDKDRKDRKTEKDDQLAWLREQLMAKKDAEDKDRAQKGELGRGQLDVDRAKLTTRPPQPYKESDSYDGAAFDPNTGSYKNAPPPQGAKRRLGVKGAAAPSYVVDPNQLGPNGETIYRNSKNPSDFVVGGGPAGAKPKKTPGEEKITDGERNAAMFYNNADNALKVLEEMESKGYRPDAKTAAKNLLVPKAFEGYAYTPDEQRYRQAAKDFTAAKLRLESGANIPQSEIDEQADIYMVKPGDSPQLIAQKTAARRSAMAGLKYKAAKGADQIKAAQGQGSGGGSKSVDDMSDAEVDAALKKKGLLK